MAHAVYIDGNEIHVVKPGIDRFKLTNLIPDHEYEVSVEARSQGEAYKRKSTSDELLSHCLVFRTPKAGRVLFYFTLTILSMTASFYSQIGSQETIKFNIS